MTSKRPERRFEPQRGIENLEGRELLTGGGVIGLDGKYINKFDYQKMMAKRANPPAPSADRRVELDISEAYGPGAKAVITLYGPGTIMSNYANGTIDYANSTHFDKKDGTIHILFDGTTSNSQIIGSVSGVSKKVFPLINEIRDKDVSPYDTTGVGTNQIGYINLNRFNLANGGRINLSAGVQRIFLNDIGHGTQLDLAALATPPTTSPQNPGGLNSTTTTSSSGSTAVTNSSGQKTITTTVNGITVITTLPTTDQLTVSNNELTGVGGIILPGSIPSTSGNTRVEVQGVELIVRNVNGADNPLGQPSPRIGDEYIAGTIDSSLNANGVADQLVYYKINRDSNLTISSASETANYPIHRQDVVDPNADTTNLTLHGAAVGQYANGTITMGNGTQVRGTVQVVAVGYSFDDGANGTRYFMNAYSVLDGSLQGYFEAKKQVGDPLNPGQKILVEMPINGIGGSGGDIFATQSGNGTSTGFTQGYDLTASLEATDHVSRLLGTPLSYPNTFNSKGGTTGVAGVSYLYNAGAAYFDAFSPLNTLAQLGIMKINDSATDVLTVGSTAKVGGSIDWTTRGDYVMGSVDQNVVMIDPEALQTLPGGSYYNAQMFSPNTLASTGSFKLFVGSNDKIAGLSEAFSPGLAGASVIDIKGNLKTFSAVNTNNMVLNVNGIANYTQIKNAQNTTILAHPILHLGVSWKKGANVNIISSARPTDTTPGGKSRPGTRGGVQIVKKLPVIGPLINPVQRGL